MADLVWWVQVLGGVGSFFLASATILTTVYSAVRGVPQWLRRLIGVDEVTAHVDEIDRKLDELLMDHRLTQQLALQQAVVFNELKDVVCEQHDIPQADRPPDMDIEAIRREVLSHEEPPDFQRRHSDDEAG